MSIDKQRFCRRAGKPEAFRTAGRRSRTKRELPVFTQSLQSLDPRDNLLQGLPLHHSAQPVTSFRGGSTEALKALRRFVKSV